MSESLDDENLITHLEALRNVLLRCVFAISLILPIGFFSSNYCINALIRWSLPSKIYKLNFFSPMEVFTIQLKIGFVISIIIAFPYLMKEIWSFLLPALHKNERKFFKTLILSSTFLFISGVVFCIYFMLPMMMKFSLSFATPNLQPTLGLSNFINLSSGLMLSFGLMFQFPLIILSLVRFGLISAESLQDKRPYIVVLILILAAIFSPPDVISQLAIGVPTYILFEIGLFFAKKISTQANID